MYGGFELALFSPLSDGTYRLNGQKLNQILYADAIINATYAYSNNILKILNLKEDFSDYKIQYI